jgi:nitrogen regulatory protein PII
VTDATLEDEEPIDVTDERVVGFGDNGATTAVATDFVIDADFTGAAAVVVVCDEFVVVVVDDVGATYYIGEYTDD